VSIGASLLTFLDAPVVVGDPDGRTAYVNPAFAARFGGGDGAVGQPLSTLFEGGVREAVLRAVVDCCEQGRSVRFRLRHAGVGYSAVASPITAESARVGVVILLFESSAAEERLLALQRELSAPVGELRRVLDELLEPRGPRRDARERSLLEDAARALGRVQKWCEELTALIGGRARS
jgi:PAS domain-containing protein